MTLCKLQRQLCHRHCIRGASDAAVRVARNAMFQARCCQALQRLSELEGGTVPDVKNAALPQNRVARPFHQNPKSEYYVVAGWKSPFAPRPGQSREHSRSPRDSPRDRPGDFPRGRYQTLSVRDQELGVRNGNHLGREYTDDSRRPLKGSPRDEEASQTDNPHNARSLRRDEIAAGYGQPTNSLVV